MKKKELKKIIKKMNENTRKIAANNIMIEENESKIKGYLKADIQSLHEHIDHIGDISDELNSVLSGTLSPNADKIGDKLRALRDATVARPTLNTGKPF